MKIAIIKLGKYKADLAKVLNEQGYVWQGTKTEMEPTFNDYMHKHFLSS